MLTEVLLSAYNGENFLAAQLDSLLAQTHADLKVLVRDDGSSDATLKILAQYAAQDSRITYYSGKNLGVVGSFFDLLHKADPSADAYFFCDHDDVWHPGKIAAALEFLARTPQSPSLYFSRLEYTNATLKPLGVSLHPKRLQFASALVENVATGCTVAFNAALRSLALKTPRDKLSACLMHDWWLYLLALGTGTVYYDPRVHILYRQHAGNAVGGSASRGEVYRRKLQRFIRRRPGSPGLTDQARLLREVYSGVLRPEALRVLDDIISSHDSLARRLSFAWRLPTRRQGHVDSWLLRILILWNRY